MVHFDVVGGCVLKNQVVINHVIAGIAQVRQDWDRPENGNLIDAKGSIGLLLADVAAAVGLQPEEQAQALGQDFYNQISEYC